MTDLVAFLRYWWRRLKDWARRSYLVAFVLGLASANEIVLATEQDRSSLRFWFELFTAVICAKWALIIWRRADVRAAMKRATKVP